MKKIGLVIPLLIILGILAVGCSKEKNLFTESGLDKVHIEKLIATNEKTKEVTNITNGDPLGEFLDEISSIKVQDNKEDGDHDSGCNVPGKTAYYVEIQDTKGNIVGDIIIGNEGEIQVNNFTNKYIKIISNKEASNKLCEIIKKGNI